MSEKNILKYIKIKNEYDLLKEQLSEEIQNKQWLTYHEYENLKAEYLKYFGNLKYTEFLCSLKFSKLKFKISLIQDKINNNDFLNLKEIEKETKDTFKIYDAQIIFMQEDLKKAKDILKNSENLKTHEYEIKKIYKKLIKKHHPEILESSSKKDKKLWLRIEKAYENFDFNLLRKYFNENYDENNSIKETITISDENISDIKKSCKNFSNLIDKYQKEISMINLSFPFDKKEILNNPEKIKKEISKFKKNIINFNLYIMEMESIIASITQPPKKFFS